MEFKNDLENELTRNQDRQGQELINLSNGQKKKKRKRPSQRMFLKMQTFPYKPKTNPKLARQIRLMTLNHPGPFYIGWDSQLQKMVLKGSQLPNTLTLGNQMPLSETLAKANHVTFDFQA